MPQKQTRKNAQPHAKTTPTRRAITVTQKFVPISEHVAIAACSSDTTTLPGISPEGVKSLLKSCKKAGTSHVTFGILDDIAFPLIVIHIGTDKDLMGYGLPALIGNFAAIAMNTAKSQGFKEIVFLLDTLTDACRKAFRKPLDADLIQTLLTCAAFSDYSYPKPEKKVEAPTPVHITLVSSKKLPGVEPASNRARIVEEAATFYRNIANDPANVLTPAVLARSAQQLFARSKARVRVYEAAEIKKLGMDLFLSVNKGSDESAKLIEVNYTGPTQKKYTAKKHTAKKHPVKIALVGKGLTFDSGGYCLKPAKSMSEMKYDMCGSALVLSVTYAAAQLGLPIQLKTVVPSTENLVNGSANKPGDVIKAKNGTTVAIDNTDAEGRLILADALTYAAEWNPDVIIDAATLTGAVSIAIGTPATGVMGNNKKLIELMKKTAQESGERVWELPLFPEYVSWFDSPVADISNISSVPEAGSSCGGIFLSHFIPDNIPWMHMDVAATSWNNNTRKFYPSKGASAAMVMSLLGLLEKLSTTKL